MNTIKIPNAGAEVISALSGVPNFEKTQSKGRLEAKLERWSTYLLAISGSLLVVLAMLAGVHQLWPVSKTALVPILITGVLIQALAILALLLQSMAGVVGAIAFYKRASVNHRNEYLHDMGFALELYKAHGLPAIKAADLWLAQKIQRMDQRQIRFFGGSEKLALVALIGVAMATWKSIGSDLLTGTPSALLFVSAFVVGITVGGLVSNAMRDKLAHQRSLLQLAQSFEGESGIGQDKLP